VETDINFHHRNFRQSGRKREISGQVGASFVQLQLLPHPSSDKLLPHSSNDKLLPHSSRKELFTHWSNAKLLPHSCSNELFTHWSNDKLLPHSSRKELLPHWSNDKLLPHSSSNPFQGLFQFASLSSFVSSNASRIVFFRVLSTH
jgi:hypothetical protein